MLMHLIVNWLLSALALWIVAQVIPGISVSSFGTALFATVIIALVNSTIGFVLKLLTLPLTLLTLGLFLLVVNAFLLKLASLFVPGFAVRGFLAALIGSVVLTLLSSLLRQVVFS
ncbi:MAG TPA: phage holin family protein [Bryobacteraceae bacterium]|nr:phage holin family protein [Bryobacteraceae bacterium]